MRARLTLTVPRVGYAALVAACFLVPVIYTRQTAEAFMVPKVTLLWLALITALVGLGTWGIAARRWPIPRLQVWWPLGAVLAWTAVAAAFSTSPTMSLLGQYGRYDGLLGVIVGIVTIAVVVAYTWRSPDRLGAIVYAIVASGVVGVVYVTIQQLGWDWVDWYNESLKPIEQPYGLLGNSNFSGAHLALVVPFVLALRQRTERRAVRVGLWGLAGYLVVGVWWTQTRGGMLALVGGVAICGLLSPELLPRLVRWAAIVAAVAALGVVFAASTADTLPGQEQIGRPAVLQAGTLADRKEIWTASLHMIQDHPLVGVGPDAFGLEFPYYRLPLAVDEAPLNADEAHNILIDRAATAGLPALAAYLWLLGVVGVAAWRGRKLVADEHRWLLGAFGGAFGGYLLQGMVSIDAVPLVMTAWVCIGALGCLTDPHVLAARTEAEDEKITLRPVPPGAMAALVGAALILASQAIRPFIADLRYRDGLEARAAGRTGAVTAADFEAATDWLDLEPRYHARLADQIAAIATQETVDPALRTRLILEAITGYDDALERAPGDARTLRAKARALVLLADADEGNRGQHLDEAAAIYRDLVEGIPTDRDLRVELGLVLEARSRMLEGKPAAALRADAVEQFEEVRRMDPSTTAALSGLARIAVDEGRYSDARGLLLQAQQIRPDDENIARALEQVEAKLAEE